MDWSNPPAKLLRPSMEGDFPPININNYLGCHSHRHGLQRTVTHTMLYIYDCSNVLLKN